MGKRILIAEDEPHIARMVTFKLEHEGYEVIWAKNGGEAVKSLQDKAPDLVLLDVMMPVMDGFEVLKKIKEDESTWHIPVIMLTAKGKIKDIDLAFDLGADDYIVKPFLPDELVERVQVLLGA